MRMVCFQFAERWPLSILEKKHERDVVKWWRQLGLRQAKLNLMGQKGWPDRLFVVPNYGVIFIEFKREGEKPEPLQDRIIKSLREAKQEVHVCFTYDEAVRILKAALESA